MTTSQLTPAKGTLKSVGFVKSTDLKKGMIIKDKEYTTIPLTVDVAYLHKDVELVTITGQYTFGSLMGSTAYDESDLVEIYELVPAN